MREIRRAAASLYSLHQEDREAILAQLSPTEQTDLRSALAELKSLGFARSIGIILKGEEPTKSADPMPTTSDSAGPTDDRWTRQLMQEDYSRIHRVLSVEPASLIADLLQIAQWPWAEPFLQKLAARRQQQVRDLLFSADPFSTSRRRWLLQSVAARVAALPPGPPTQPARRMRSALRPTRWFPWRA